MPRSLTMPDGTLHVFPDNASDKDIGAILGVGPDSLAQLFTADSTRVKVGQHFRNKPKRFTPESNQPEIKTSQRLPYAGAIGGAIGGAVGGIPGAAAGGAIGRIANRLATDIPNAAQGGSIPTPAETLKDIAYGGAEQAGLELVGRGVGKLASKGGEKLMGVALRAAPEVAQTAIKEGITHTRAGVAKAMNRLGELGARTTAMLRNSTNQGTRFQTVDFLTGAEQKLAADLAENRLPAAADDEAVFKDLSSKFLKVNANLNELTPLQLQKIKQDADQIADPIFRALKRKKPIEAGTLASARWHKAVSDYARDQLERTTPDIINHRTGQVLSLRAANAETGALKGLKDVMVPEVSEMGLMEQALQRSTRPLAMAGAGAGLGAAFDEQLPGNRMQGALLGAGIGAGLSPAALSQQALMLNSPLIQLLLRQSPRAVNEIFREE